MMGVSRRFALRLTPDLAPPALGVAAPPDAPLVDPAATGLDDATTAYVATIQPAFDLLRGVAGQIAGVLMLAVAAGKGAAGHPMLDAARHSHDEARDAIGGVRVPKAAAHHHFHLRAALDALAEALEATRRHLHRGDDAAIDRVLGPVKVAYRELDSASRALPGFEMVALSQCCCAQFTKGSDERVITAIT